MGRHAAPGPPDRGRPDRDARPGIPTEPSGEADSRTEGHGPSGTSVEPPSERSVEPQPATEASAAAGIRSDGPAEARTPSRGPAEDADRAVDPSPATPADPPAEDADRGTDPNPATPAAPPADSADEHIPGWRASVLVGLLVGLVTTGVLWWASQAPGSAALIGAGAALVVVVATWAARSLGGSQPGR